VPIILCENDNLTVFLCISELDFADIAGIKFDFADIAGIKFDFADTGIKSHRLRST